MCVTYSGNKHGTGDCNCLPPFILYPFPTEKRDPQGRRKWIQLINRKDEKTGKNWIPKRFSRVCSRHFRDGKPTITCPYPSLHLDYLCGTPAKGARKPPTPRSTVAAATSSVRGTPDEASHTAPLPCLPSSSQQKPCPDHNYAAPAKPCDKCGIMAQQLKASEADNLRTKVGMMRNWAYHGIERPGHTAYVLWLYHVYFYKKKYINCECPMSNSYLLDIRIFNVQHPTSKQLHTGMILYECVGDNILVNPHSSTWHHCRFLPTNTVVTKVCTNYVASFTKWIKYNWHH